MNKKLENLKAQISFSNRFKFSYYQLNYRQRFIRTLMCTPFVLVAFLIPIKHPIMLGIVVITYLRQLIYTYFMWKKNVDHK